MDLRAIEWRVWLFLVVLTAGSFTYGVQSGRLEGSGPMPLAVTIMLLIALAKAWLVMRYFMELRHAPPLLRRIADVWVGFTTCVVFGGYLFFGLLFGTGS